MKMNTWKSLTVSSVPLLLIGLPQAKPISKAHRCLQNAYLWMLCRLDKAHRKKDFITTVFHPENINELKRQKGIKPQYQSCHTGISGWLHFRGHIPARFIKGT